MELDDDRNRRIAVVRLQYALVGLVEREGERSAERREDEQRKLAREAGAEHEGEGSQGNRTLVPLLSGRCKRRWRNDERAREGPGFRRDTRRADSLSPTYPRLLPGVG